MLTADIVCGTARNPMRTFSQLTPTSTTRKPFAERSDASLRDSVRILRELVMQMSERIELLETRELLLRPR